MSPVPNVFRLCLHPGRRRARTVNFDEWASYLVRQLRRTILLTGDAALGRHRGRGARSTRTSLGSSARAGRPAPTNGRSWCPSSSPPARRRCRSSRRSPRSARRSTSPSTNSPSSCSFPPTSSPTRHYEGHQRLDERGVDLGARQQPAVDDRAEQRIDHRVEIGIGRDLARGRCHVRGWPAAARAAAACRPRVRRAMRDRASTPRSGAGARRSSAPSTRIAPPGRRGSPGGRHRRRRCRPCRADPSPSAARR